MSELEVCLGGKVIGYVTRTAHDFPWDVGAFRATLEYSPVRELFENELKLLNLEEEERWSEAWDQIDAMGLLLRDAKSGKVFDEAVILHIDGEKAWWRMP